MANPSRLTLAAYLVRDSIQLQLTELEWPDRLEIPVYDHEASIFIGGKQYKGRGVHREKSQSIDIAIAEAFERSLFESEKLPKNFGGLAVHQDSSQAEYSARLELIERDSFFCHFLTSTPTVPTDKYLASETGARLEKLGNQCGFQLIAGALTAPDGYFVSAIAVNGTNCDRRPFGAILGLGCSDTSQEASLEKALREVLPNLANALLSEHVDSITADELLEVPTPNPKHHRQWALDRGSWDAVAPCFTSIERRSPVVPLDAEEIITTNLAQSEYWPTIIPLAAATATHPSAARTFFGANRNALKFLPRLSQFLGRPFDEKQLPTLPHPLG